MKRQIYAISLHLILVSFFGSSYGQVKRYAYEEITTGCNCPEFEWNGLGRNLKDIKASDNDFEIRLIISPEWGYRSTTVISRKNGRYEGHYYSQKKNDLMILEDDSLIKYKGKWEKYNYKKFSLARYNLDSIVKVLMGKEITKLPNQNEVYRKPFLTIFTIEYKVDGNTRSYRFGPPKELIQEFPDELIYRRYDAILDIFSEMTNPMGRQIIEDRNFEWEKEKRDTVFLRKPSANGHSIYIDKDEDGSPYFDKLTNLDYTIADKEYFKSVKSLLKHKQHSKDDINFGTMPRNWVELHRYKGEYYVYAPAKAKEVKVSFNDSTMIVQSAKKEVRLINGVQQIDKNNYSLKSMNSKGEIRSFKIHFIHRSRGLAVFENYYGKGLHMLMVSVENADRFPLITNHSPQHNDQEYRFEKPDFEKILNPPQYIKRPTSAN